ncbi:hypothetical protein FGSG_13401 [Fusarium graminearum PH-1]|uniref:hypothetical protein n=1 Tax=Gibberella zeae (strain ATCC MYA-4620 / CBS 123657 / FGSC 9075 / NRRL 31084 / PH-1) TaxID=229533 RepID=UPI00021F1942|nr:hypothetical protein FGSG_13401 [Fusarium graminearum PH-1]ESU15095.1 hypothetical protein FGSG_13401 [Fusarium graminearum PH-1]|eukprot:XP_011320520.1 hypothetical protein FGSG_13401 [Fusarium graminearum PH-1]
MLTTQRSQIILDPRDYKVAWIAPLEIEAKAAMHLLDELHPGRFPVDRGDDYVFQAGAMAGHSIVIATLPAGQHYGNVSAAGLAGQVKRFFPNLWFGLLVGVAAGLPDLSCVPARDIRLGDVLVGLSVGESAGLVPYDLGKETDDGFQPLRLGHSLSMTEPIVRSAIGNIRLQAPNDTEVFLPYYEKICNCKHATGTFADPGQDNDILFNDDGDDKVVERPRRPKSNYQRARVWYGPIGSGDKLLKNAKKRNELRDKYGIIGLEMEAAGIMNRIPVGVIRGVCDYGDRHKNKDWQPYAAAMAASYARALLDEIPSSQMTTDMIQRAYGDIAKQLRLQKTSEDEDVKDLVCRYLSSDEAGKWLFIVDNADDRQLVNGSYKKPGLEEYLPQNENGIVLLTTRSGHVAEDFAQSEVIDIQQMNLEEATTLLKKSLTQRQLLQDEVAIVKLLTYLTCLPLAITQAASYINQTKVPVRTYLGLLRNDEVTGMKVLEREFRGNTRRDRSSQNAVGTTWIVSFRQIQKSNQLAIDLLSFISCIDPHAIPQSILPDARPGVLEWALGTLCSFSFLVCREESDVFDMHGLVHTATRTWLQRQNQERQISNNAIRHLAAKFPGIRDAHYDDLRREYLPHVMRLLSRNHEDHPVEILKKR